MKYLFIIPFLSIFFFSCAEEHRKQPVAKHNNPDLNLNSAEADTLIVPPAEVDAVTIEEIDSLVFNHEKQRVKPLNKKYTAITDHIEAARLLKGKVTFGVYDEKSGKLVKSDTGSVVYEVYPERRKPILLHEYSEFYFMAYYPELHLIVGEGGHTSDYSYDLLTGDETEIAGNPDYMYTSKDGSIRLNGWFPGQECVDSYIQQRINGRYYNTVELSEAFWKKFAGNYGICNYRDAFWEGNRKLFIKTNTHCYLVTLTLPE